MKHYNVTNDQLTKILAVVCPLNTQPLDTEAKRFRISIDAPDAHCVKQIINAPEGTGLKVTGLTAEDNTRINALTLAREFGEMYCAVYKNGFWFFPEREEFQQTLYYQLEEEFKAAGIEAKIEAIS